MISLNSLYKKATEDWRLKNIRFFGMTSVSRSFSIEEIDNTLKADAEQFWNSPKDCPALQVKLLDKKTLKDYASLVPRSFALVYNKKFDYIDIFADFVVKIKTSEGKTLREKEKRDFVDSHKEDISLKRNSQETDSLIQVGTNEVVVEQKKICSVPVVTSLGFRIGFVDYALRIQAFSIDPYLLKKENGQVNCRHFCYKDGALTVNSLEGISEQRKDFIKEILSRDPSAEEITPAVIKRAMDQLQEFDRHSLLYFGFKHYEEVEKVIEKSTLTANATAGKIINYAELLLKENKYSKSRLKDVSSSLVCVKNELEALVACRSVYLPVKESLGGFKPAFSFTDTDGIFDAYKLTTNSMAGRVRLLLDDVIVEDGTLKIENEEEKTPIARLILSEDKAIKRLKARHNLSCLSESVYNYLNDPKRIMLCSKLRTQAVRVVGEEDPLTHEVPARVVFGDYQGFSCGDSFIISKSFAEKLKRENVELIYKIEKEKTVRGCLWHKGRISLNMLKDLTGKDNLPTLKNIEIVDVLQDGKKIKIKADIPFGVGDKITNLHGSKGVVSLILPDEKMPFLVNDLSEAMKCGAIDVIVPGLSIFKRKSTGQIFEAITKAMGLNSNLSLDELYEHHFSEIQKYDNLSIFDIEGEKAQAPCGINSFIRLYHDSGDKLILSKTPQKEKIRLAQMESLNLKALSKNEILREIDARSLLKNSHCVEDLRWLEKSGFNAYKKGNTRELELFFRYLGWDISIKSSKTEEIDSRMTPLLDYFERC